MRTEESVDKNFQTDIEFYLDEKRSRDDNAERYLYENWDRMAVKEEDLDFLNKPETARRYGNYLTIKRMKGE